MPNSREFHNLELRLGQLRGRFLPRKIDPTMKYTKAQIDKTRAYTVLAHAEIEQFIEDACESVALCVLQEWNSGKRLGRPTVALASFTEVKKSPPDKCQLEGKPQLTQRLEDAKKLLSHYVRMENNGVSERDLARMLFPVGLMETDIPAGWLDLMNELCNQRGAVAHKSALGKVVREPHPHAEYERITKILDGLKKIDECLASFQFS